MTKDEEIAHYSAFVANLPKNTYLRDILADTVEEVIRMIRNDVAMPESIVALWREKLELDKELYALRQQFATERDAHTKAVVDAERRLAIARRELAKIQDAAKDLLNYATPSKEKNA